jgi:hypothetical protein
MIAAETFTRAPNPPYVQQTHFNIPALSNLKRGAASPFSLFSSFVPPPRRQRQYSTTPSLRHSLDFPCGTTNYTTFFFFLFKIFNPEFV